MSQNNVVIIRYPFLNIQPNHRPYYEYVFSELIIYKHGGELKERNVSSCRFRLYEISKFSRLMIQTNHEP